VARRLTGAPQSRAAAPAEAPRPAGRPREHGGGPIQDGPGPAGSQKQQSASVGAKTLRNQVADLEASLLHAQERLHQITETSLDIICHFKPDGVFAFVSRAAIDVLGYPPQEMIGTHFRDYFPPGDLSSAAAIFELALAGERIDLIELTARHKDGHAVPLEVCAVALVRAGRVIGIQGIARDISKRKGTEDGLRVYAEQLERLIQAHDRELASARESFALRLGRSQAMGRILREREELLRAAFEQAAIGLALADPDGRFLRVNLRLAEMLGQGREELLARRWQDVTSPDDFAQEQALWRRLRAGEIHSFAGERRCLRCDGSHLLMRVLVSAIRTKGSLPSHVMLAVEPIA